MPGVYLAGVFTSAWPRRAWRPRLGTPCSSLWVATLGRRVGPPPFWASPACAAARCTALCRPESRPGRTHPMPAGLPRRLGVCPGQRLGEGHFAEARFTVLVMAGLHRLDLRRQRVPQVAGPEGRPVLTALAAPDPDAVLADVHVLAAQAAAIEPPRDFRLGEPGGRAWSALAADRGDGALTGLVQDSAGAKPQGV
jgi:hypothetical protein